MLPSSRQESAAGTAKNAGNLDEKETLAHNEKKQVLLVCALLIAITAVAFWRVAGCDFINFDDELYVRYNPLIANGLTATGVRQAMTSTYQAIWMPLVWISYMADNSLSAVITHTNFHQTDPHICHITNLMLHIANVILLFVCLKWMTRRCWLSAFVALLFAVHPLRVESVAWIAERKDVLSTLFWMLTMLGYLHYLRKPGIFRYGLVLLSYVLGLMAKPMLVTLPLTLLILDYWPLCRLGSGGENCLTFLRALREKIPMLLLAIPCGVITFLCSSAHTVARSVENRANICPLGERIANALVSYVEYISMMFWPRNLAVFYPHPRNTLPVGLVAASALLLFALCLLALRQSRRRPYITAGWLWYTITIIPVIELVPIGREALADRYTYVPMIGLSIAFAWLASDMLGQFQVSPHAKQLAAAAATCVVVVLTLLTYIQVGYWQDSFTLFTHTVRVTGPNAVARRSLGAALLDMGRTDEGIQQFKESVRIDPRDSEVVYKLTRLLTMRGSQADLDEAVVLLQSLVALHPKSDLAHNQLGLVLAKRGAVDAAIAQFRDAVRLSPNKIDARENLDWAMRLARRKTSGRKLCWSD